MVIFRDISDINHIVIYFMIMFAYLNLCNMKIEFDVDDQEGLLLLSIFKRFMGQTNSPEALKSLSKIAAKIEKEMKISDEIFNRLKFRLIDYTNGNKIELLSNMKKDLGISSNFITRTGGLEREANNILENLYIKYKPTKKTPQIALTSIKQCKTVSDVVAAIQETYED